MEIGTDNSKNSSSKSIVKLPYQLYNINVISHFFSNLKNVGKLIFHKYI